MDRDEVWRTIDQQRAELADLMETFTDADWETPSLCEGWRVREVGAHLTLAQTGLLEAMGATVRARGSFNRMIHDTAVRQAERPVAEYPALLRAMIGSRRKAPFVSDLEPLIDQLVHGQDMVVPLGRTREMPQAAAAAAAQRAWDLNWPFRVKKQAARLQPVRDGSSRGRWVQGPVVEGPIRALLMLVTGRHVVLPELSGPGADELRARLQPSRVS